MSKDQLAQRSIWARIAWPLLVLTAVLQIYFGLSAVAYLFMGVGNPASGPGAWLSAAMGGLQAAASLSCLVRSGRGDLASTTLLVAASMIFGWLSMVPAALAQGLDFDGADKATPVLFLVTPLQAMAAALLARGNRHPVAGALVAGAATFVGILIVLAFGLVIAVHGF